MSRPASFSRRLFAWFDAHGRKNLPWRRNRTAYRVWLSEVMLQQTQVTTVIPYFEKFIAHFPEVRDLALADGDQVMRLWAGLGYYARARNLHICAQQLNRRHGGAFPESVELLQQLPGIGRSTAGAIVAQAYNRRALILDGNVKRVLARYRMVSGWTGKATVQKTLWGLADSLTPACRPADYTQAVMDLGATVCRRSRPACEQCPVQSDCLAAVRGTVEQYPEKQARAPLPTREIHVLLCYQVGDPQRILLEKRPPSGIWGGLWSLPQCEPVQAPAEVIEAQYGYTIEATEKTDTIVHTFTHFRLRIRPLIIRVSKTSTMVVESSVSWYDAEQANMCGMPAPIAKLVADFFVCD